MPFVAAQDGRSPSVISGADAAQGPTATPPNIIFIVADDMFAHMFNCLPEGRKANGDPKNLTPAIDRLATEGTVMLGQHVASPVCTPSRYSCLTGLYASRSKSKNFLRETKRRGQSVVQWTSFVTDELTLPKLLQQRGYVTGMVGKNHVIDGKFPKVGYEEDASDPGVIARLKKRQAKVHEVMKRGGFDYVASIYQENPDHNGPRELAVHNLDWTTDGALKFIDASAERPFFLYYATTTPHGPGEPKRSWKADPRIIPTGFLETPLDVLPARETIPQRLKAAGIRPDATRCNLLWMDDSVAAILERIESRGIEDNTIVVFFNDHGQAAKGTLYQGGVTDPSIVWRKGGFPCGNENRTLVSNIDFAPTLLELAGGDPKTHSFDGASFLPSLNGKADAIHASLYFEMGFSRAVIKDGWKYLALRYPAKAISMPVNKRQVILDRFNASQRLRGRPVYTTDPMTAFSHISLIPGGGDAEAMSTGKKSSYFDADQLFNLNADPSEQTNLADDPEMAEKLQEMKAELKSYLENLPGGFAELKPAR